MATDETDGYRQIFEGNRDWARRLKRINPSYFEELSRQQAPQFLWIGCSDSRVPANEILDLLPGQVFVHRNIANVVVESDLNCLSVLQYAIEVLGVRHVIVCGHYGCGGVRAALSDEAHGLIDNWLNHLRKVQRLHAPVFEGVNDPEERADLLCELNVIEQVHNVSETTIVRDAWRAGSPLEVHGVIYALKNGLLHELCIRTRTGYVDLRAG